MDKKKSHNVTNRIMKNDVVTPMSQGGTQNKRVTAGLYPIVAAMVGKKSMYDAPTCKKHPAAAGHQTIQSVRASTRPDNDARFCSQLHVSSSILL